MCKKEIKCDFVNVFWSLELKDKIFSLHKKVSLSLFKINHHLQFWPQAVAILLSVAIC